MLRFIVRRLLLLVPILLGLSILIFLWIRALPGGPTEALLGERATPAAVAQIRHQLGLDKPIYEQYWAYVRTTASGNLGISIASRRPVTTEIRERFPATVELAFAAMIFALVRRPAARVLRREAAREHVRPLEPRRLADRDLDPDLLPRDHPQVHLLGAARLAAERRPPGRADRRAAPDELLRPRRDRDGELEAAWDAIKHLILPAIALGSIPLAIIARITRASALDVQNEDYVRTARAKGMSPGIVDRRHVLRNALLPVVDDHRPPGRPAALGRRAHRDGLRDARHGLVARAGDLQPRLPGDPGRRPLPRDRLRVRQPDRRPLVRASSTRGSGSREHRRDRGSDLHARRADGGLWHEAWRRLRRDRGAIVGFVFVSSSCSSRSSRR